MLRAGQPGGRLVGRHPQLEQALRPGAAAVRPAGPEQVTGAGHGLQLGTVPDDSAGLRQVLDHHDVAQQLGGGRGQPVRRPHQVYSVGETGGRGDRCD